MGSTENLPSQLKTALVTGGGGFVGRAVVNRLLELGVDVRVLGRNDYPDLRDLGVTCHRGSIGDKQLTMRASEGVDVVFHIAALAGIWGSWKDYYNTNVRGTENVIAACQTNNVPSLVYTSTPSVVFNSEDIEAGDEGMGYADKFLCHYARSKVLAEQLVLAAASDELKTCALRPHLIWGPGDPHLLPRIVASGRKKRLKKVGSGCNLVDISYIDNVAEAHILAAINLATLGTGSGKAYFISQEQPVNLWDWIDGLFAQLGVARIEKTVSFTTAYRLGWLLEILYTLLGLKKEPGMTRFVAEQLAKSHYFSIEQAKKDLGYREIISTEEGLRRTIEWLKKQ